MTSNCNLIKYMNMYHCNVMDLMQAALKINVLY